MWGTKSYSGGYDGRCAAVQQRAEFLRSLSKGGKKKLTRGEQRTCAQAKPKSIPWKLMK